MISRRPKKRRTSPRKKPTRDERGRFARKPVRMLLAPEIRLRAHERRCLGRWARNRSEPERAFRAQIVLRAARGLTNAEIARELSTSPKTVSEWRRRFLVERLACIRSGLRRGISKALARKVLRAKRRGLSTRKTAEALKALGVSSSTVSRIWRRERPRAIGRPWAPAAH